MDHPVDALPEYVRGKASNAQDIERHLAECESCSLDVEVLMALRDAGPPPLSDIEIERTHRRFEARRLACAADTGGSAGPGRSGAWLTPAWRVAAGIALLLTSVGVLRVVQGDSSTDWDPDVAIEGWLEELADLDLPAPELRLALGVSLLDDPVLGLPWGDLEEIDMGELPWESER